MQPRIHMWLLGSFAAIAMLLIHGGSLWCHGVLGQQTNPRNRSAYGCRRDPWHDSADDLWARRDYGVQLDTWLLLAACCVVIAFTGAIGTYLPARRAASIDPVQALRVE